MNTLIDEPIILDAPTLSTPEAVAAGDPNAERQLELIERLEKRRFNIHAKPPESRPRFFIGATPICTSGNITTISAGVKSGKSSFVGAIISSAMARNPKECDCLGVRSANEQGEVMIHLDTEQSPADHYALIERAMRRAKLAEPPSWFQSYCVTGFTVLDLCACLTLLLGKAKESGTNIHSVLIDGVADLVQDVNDPAECNGLVGQLHALAIKYDCVIVCVIHLNPGSDKTRGHLGSQLERKAETNLRLEKEGETVVVYSEKNRRAPITKANGPCFKWSEQQGMHVSVQTLQHSKDAEETQELSMLADDVFNGRSGIRYCELVSTVKTKLGVQDRTAQRRINRMTALGVIKKCVSGVWERGV